MRKKWEQSRRGAIAIDEKPGLETPAQIAAVEIYKGKTTQDLYDMLTADQLEAAYEDAAQYIEDFFDPIVVNLEQDVHGEMGLVNLLDFPTSKDDIKKAWTTINRIAIDSDPTLLKLRVANGMYGSTEWDDDVEVLILGLAGVVAAGVGLWLAAPTLAGASSPVVLALYSRIAHAAPKLVLAPKGAVMKSAAGVVLTGILAKVRDDIKAILGSMNSADMRDSIERTTFLDGDIRTRWNPVRDALARGMDSVTKMYPGTSKTLQKATFLRQIRQGINSQILKSMGAMPAPPMSDTKPFAGTGKSGKATGIKELRSAIRKTIISEGFGTDQDPDDQEPDPPGLGGDTDTDPEGEIEGTEDAIGLGGRTPSFIDDEVEISPSKKTTRKAPEKSLAAVQTIKKILNKSVGSDLDVNDRRWGKKDGPTDQAWWKFIDKMWSDSFGDKSTVVGKYWIDVARSTGKGYSPTPVGALKFLNDLVNAKEQGKTTTVARVDSNIQPRVPEYKQGSVYQRTRAKDELYIGKTPVVQVVGVDKSAISPTEKKEIADFFKVIADDMQIGQFTVQITQTGRGPFRIEDNTTVVRGTGRPLIKVRGRSGDQRLKQLTKLIKKFKAEKIGKKRGQTKGKNFIISVKRGGYGYPTPEPPPAPPPKKTKVEPPTPTQSRVATVGEGSVMVKGMNVSITEDRNLKIGNTIYRVNSGGLKIPFDKIETPQGVANVVMRVYALNREVDFDNDVVDSISGNVKAGKSKFDVKTAGAPTTTFTKVS